MTLKEALATHKLLLSDGGIGTQLQQLGLEPGGCGDEWNLSHPEHVATVHRNYVSAGSQLITTNTFSSNRFVLSNYGLENRQADIARSGAKIAKSVARNKAWVMGSVGPCGGFLQPLGEIDPAELEVSLRTQISALMEGGADAILVETMTAVEEVELSVRVAKDVGAPYIIATGSFDPSKTGPRTMMGVPPEQFASAAVAAGADAVGANCGTLVEPADFVTLAERLRSAANVPIMIQPNGGQPSLEGDKIMYHIPPEKMAERLCSISKHANIVGGCCGTSPAHIRALRARLDQVSAASCWD